MTLNAIGVRGDAASRYRAASDGLRAFDDLSHAVAARRDAVVRDVGARAAAAYPAPARAHVSTAASAGTLIGSAVAAFAASEAGRAAIEHAISTAAGALKGIFGTAEGAAQLPLPFA
jgi:hypothetical protein